MYSARSYFLSTYCVLSAFLGAMESGMNKTGKLPDFSALPLNPPVKFQ